MKKRKIFLAHNNMDLIVQFEKLIHVNGVFELTDYVFDGQEFERIQSFDDYDIVIVKDALIHVSGLYMIESVLKRTIKLPKLILLLTPFINDFIINKCNQLGILYKNFEVSNAYSIFDLLYKYDIDYTYSDYHFFDIQYEIIALFRKMGMLRGYIGYTYFEYILNVMFAKNETMYKPMKDIYVLIANHFTTSTVSVEKAMRTCLRSSLMKNSNPYTRRLFGLEVNQTSFPSTSTFIQVCIKTLKEQKTKIISNSIKKSQHSI